MLASSVHVADWRLKVPSGWLLPLLRPCDGQWKILTNACPQACIEFAFGESGSRQVKSQAMVMPTAGRNTDVGADAARHPGECAVGGVVDLNTRRVQFAGGLLARLHGRMPWPVWLLTVLLIEHSHRSAMLNVSNAN